MGTIKTSMALFFRERYNNNMMSVAEYASLAGISPRAVRLRAEAGTLLAQKVGHAWIVDDVERQRLRRGLKPYRGRPLTAAGFERLALFIDDATEALTPEWRRRGKILARRLHTEPLEELHRLSSARTGKLHLYRADPETIDTLRKSNETQPTGVSDPRQTVSPGGTIDLYIRESDLHRLTTQNGLLPVQDKTRANVYLRVVDGLPRPSILRLAADLLDYGNPRTDDQAESLIREATGKVVQR